MIKLVDINKIHHHPDNPRKDLGDLTELADSIRQNGILQNLTLVPWYSKITGEGADDPKQQEELGYYAVIGNRRLAAAKLAGLTEVPAVIRTDMDHKTQVATMLLENMQRSDLTAYEQAQGFQMMLDLGESVSNISEKTGLSKSTVYSRMKLLELDQDKLKSSVQRGATLMDYIELEKIEDIKLRNKVLEKVGTDDFNWSLRGAIDKERKIQRRDEIITKLEEFAEQIEKYNNSISYVKYYGFQSDIEIEIPEDVDTTKYFYIVETHAVTLYKENTEIEENIDAKEKEIIKREKRDARYAELEEISKRAYKLRSEFVKDLSNTKAKKNIETVIEASLFANIGNGTCIECEDLAEIMGIDIGEDDIEWKDIVVHIWKQPELYLLQATYYQLDSIGETYFNWDSSHSTNEELDYVYDFLGKLGYKMSEEEKQLQDGTHELFKAEEE